MDDVVVQVLTSLGTVLGAGGGAWYGLKVALNGTKASVDEIKSDVKGMHKMLTAVDRRLVGLEGKTEVLSGDVSKIHVQGCDFELRRRLEERNNG